MKAQGRLKKQRALKAVAQKKTVVFEINPYYEQLLELREKKPAAYKVMSTATHLAVEAYVKAKVAAVENKAVKAAA